MKPLGILLFSLSFFGNFLLGKSVYLSDQVSDSICQQHQKFTESGELQKAVKSGSGSSSASKNGACGWYQVKNGKDAGCAASIATFIECRIIEQRQSPDFKTKNAAKTQGSGRIVGGEDAERYEFPSIITMTIDRDDQITCSATLISPKWVVSAAHCIGEEVTLPFFRLVAGQHDVNETDEQNPARQRRGVTDYYVHEMYDEDTFENDIALMKVDKPFELNDKVKAVTLPDPEYRADGVFTVIGWGLKSENGVGSYVLQKVDVPFVEDESCNAAYSQLNQTTTESMICAGLPEGGKDACQGDSGGPLFSDGDKQILAGIVSWGEGCARPGIPGVYTEVAYFIDWIKKHTCME